MKATDFKATKNFFFKSMKLKKKEKKDEGDKKGKNPSKIWKKKAVYKREERRSIGGEGKRILSKDQDRLRRRSRWRHP